MSFSVVQSKGDFNNLGVSQSDTFTSSVTGGNAIVVFTAVRAAGNTIQSVTDNKGNTYTKLASDNTNAGAEFWMATNVIGGSVTVTVTWNGSGNPGIGVAIFEVAGGVTTQDVTAHTADGSGTNPSLGSITTVTAGDICFAGIAYNTGLTGLTAGSGWTLTQGAGAGAEYQVQASAGALTGNFGNTNSGTWSGVIIALRAGSGGGGGGSSNFVQVIWWGD